MNQILEISLTTEKQQLINADLAHNFGVIPKEIEADLMSLYVDENMVYDNLENELGLILGKKVKLFLTPSQVVKKALTIYYRLGDQRLDGLVSENKAANINSNDFLEQLIWEAKKIGSSDIHFEIGNMGARIRFRIDGALLEKYKIEKSDYGELVNKIKIKANLDITEKRLPQDGRINFDDFDLRVSVLPTMYGEKVVTRILGRDSSNLSLDSIGMDDYEKKIYLNSLKSTRGIILISGPTGSGKTTTLYASLRLLNKTSHNIVTIEDPIEYTLDGINQVQLREDIGLNFASALRTFLRQDPDVIMLGEIRDAKTAEMAIRASLTGHLVLSTIHTNSAMGTISRLVDMGVPSFLIAETLKISVAQRLLRKLCEECKKVSNTLPNEIVGLDITSISKHWLADGCQNCHYTGYKGRTAIYEMIPINNELIHQIKSNFNDLSSYLNDKDHIHLSDKAMQLVSEGVTSIEEVYPILIESKI